MAENERSLALKRERKEVEERRTREEEERCREAWEEYEKELVIRYGIIFIIATFLTNGKRIHFVRSANRQEDERAVESFLRQQMTVRDRERAEEREESLRMRRQAEDLAEKLSSVSHHQRERRRRWLREELKEEREALEEERRERRRRREEVEEQERERAKREVRGNRKILEER